MRKVTAVHFGPGRLGLGLVIPALLGSGIAEVFVAVGYRPDESRESFEVSRAIDRNHGYYLHFPAGRVRQSSQLIPIRCRVTQLEPIPLEGIDALIVTMSVGPYIDDETKRSVAAVCGRAAEQRVHVYVIPCENRLSSSYRQFLSELQALGCEIRESVVDRVCIDRGISQGQVTVTTEPYWSWMISSPEVDVEDQLTSLIPASGLADRGVGYTSSISAYHKRKSYFVNGSHVALSLKLLAQTPPVRWSTLDEFVDGCEGIRELLERMHIAYSSCLLEEFPNVFDETGLRAFSQQLVDRLGTEPDSAHRIVRRLTPNDYRDFIVSYAERVHMPILNVDPDLAKELVNDFYVLFRRRDLMFLLFVEYLRQAASPTGSDRSHGE